MAATAVCVRSEKIGDEFCRIRNGSENRFKRGRHKTVTWPVDHKICEVRHFLVDDAPSSLGAAIQEHLQCEQSNAHEAYHSSRLHVPGVVKRARLELEVDVPPGFGQTPSGGKSSRLNAQLDAVMAVTCQWRGPPKLLLDASWLWAGGEESLEVASQQQRERRFFEAFYPRLASIPDSPSEPLQESNKEIDDTPVAEVPLVPLEEQEPENEDMEQESISTAGEELLALPSNGSLHGILFERQQESSIGLADSNMAAAAAAACIVVKALGESDLVDEKLLLELLKNPSLLKSLTCYSSNNMNGKSQDQDNTTGSSSSSLQVAHQEPASSSKLNRSPVSVLAEWGDGISTNNLHRFGPNVNGSTDVQLSTNVSCMSSNPLPPTSLPTPYPCSNLDSSRVLVHEGAECTPRICSEEIPETSRTIPNDPFSNKHVYVPRVGLNGSNKDPYAYMQAAMATNSPFSVHSDPLPSKDVLHRDLMQLGPLKYRSNEDSAVKRKMGSYSSSSRIGGRTPRLCMYYNSPRGCRNGASCAFAHQSLGLGVNTITQ